MTATLHNNRSILIYQNSIYISRKLRTVQNEKTELEEYWST